jgi:hypothetical protein
LQVPIWQVPALQNPAACVNIVVQLVPHAPQFRLSLLSAVSHPSRLVFSFALQLP